MMGWWKSVGESLAQMTLLASVAFSETRNMAEF